MSTSRNTIRGVVLEALPNLCFKVELVASKNEVRCYLAGKMRLNKVRVLIGDKVDVVVPPGSAIGRIQRRA